MTPQRPALAEVLAALDYAEAIAQLREWPCHAVDKARAALALADGEP